MVERLSLDEAPYHTRWNAIRTQDSCHEISMRFQLSSIPAGVPTWYIARQHRFTTTEHTHWRNGVLFQDRKQHHLALTIAYPHERYLRLTVRGPFPQDFFALLNDGIELTLERFPGLEIKRLVPCQCRPGCPHEYDLEDLQNQVARNKPTIECPKSADDVPVAKMLYGIAWTEPNAVLDHLITIENKLDGQSALIQREFLKLFTRAQSLEELYCPNVFVLRPHGATGWRKALEFAGTKFELQLLCQCRGCWHPTEQGGVYEIDKPAERLGKMAPYMATFVKALKFAAPLASPLLKGYLGETEVKVFELNLKATEQIVRDYLPADIKAKNPESDDAMLLGADDKDQVAEGRSLRIHRNLLDLKDPLHDWGGLKRVLTPEGHYLWLCQEHAVEYKR